jgi:hypothetical protein
MEHRRTWTMDVDGVKRRIDVVYRALTGWMEIEVDGVRQARGWREWQTVVGGAQLSCVVDGHRVEARVTQPFGRQDYAFALKIDGVLQPGSDPQPEPGALKRQTLQAVGVLALVIFVVVAGTTILRTLN